LKLLWNVKIKWISMLSPIKWVLVEYTHGTHDLSWYS
jgi:hypothetical protein